MNEYKELIAVFCYYAAQLSKFALLAESGKKINEQKLSYALNSLKHFKPLLLQKKEELGFMDGLDFMENNGFLGFKVINGRFCGDKNAVKKIILPWIEGFPDNSNHYRYEVSCYLYYMAEPDRINLYPDEINKKQKRNSLKHISLNEMIYQIGKRRRLWIKSYTA